ncbi:helix-turn-helix domain-containing protein [Bacillus cereus]|uniref:helix-turn-helix domain-containing protein n=1 Tax=Bacillus cereus group TaxID=86661 RepID=UPI000BEBDA67|nr:MULTISPECIES: helix-turn-helix domain-containing protein [Bacillus cereus group]MDA2109992.1 helix-turn-helix domain-containing protein [Bacillus cereus]MDA2126982.1 helix-turn-helix domain-containing protein [Bacillus cereus]MDA2149691.1 helix-turn-helix domain-containing protein [Bacillus cereus]MDA2534055.1 helix-turn-helix domain-containing protein [Bacillus cereus]MEB9162836.1 helix-turn-helix domain-containing protein [Bacillus cereus]
MKSENLVQQVEEMLQEIRNHENYDKLAAEIQKDMINQPMFDKSINPKEKDHTLDFIKMPTNLRYYSYMQDYGVTESALILYQIIIDFFNVKEKKAFPSQYRLAMETGKSIRTINHNIKILQSVGLVTVKRRGIGRSNEYIPLLPLTLDELLKRFPKAEERYYKQALAVEKIRKSDEEKKHEIMQRIERHKAKSHAVGTGTEVASDDLEDMRF